MLLNINSSTFRFSIGDYVKLNEMGIDCSLKMQKAFKQNKFGKIYDEVSFDSGSIIYSIELLENPDIKELWFDYHLLPVESFLTFC